MSIHNNKLVKKVHKKVSPETIFIWFKGNYVLNKLKTVQKFNNCNYSIVLHFFHVSDVSGVTKWTNLLYIGLFWQQNKETTDRDNPYMRSIGLIYPHLTLHVPGSQIDYMFKLLIGWHSMWPKVGL